MPFSGGVYSAPSSSWNPAVDDTDIDASDWASLLADMSTALSTCLLKDGSQTVTANIPLGGYKITGLGTGSAVTDAANVGQTMTLLQTLTASTSATLTFTGFSSTYNTYFFEFDGILAATDNVNLEAQLSTDGGSTWLTGSHYWYGADYWNTSTTTAGGFFTVTSANTIWLLNIANGGQLSNANVFNGRMRLQNANSSSLYQMFDIDFLFKRTGADYYYGGNGQGLYDSAGVKNAIKFFMSSGNITSGSIKVYGIP